MRPIVVNSLQEICLNCVVKNFAQFITIYDNKLEIIPRKHFEFLQRTYSKVVLDKLVDLDNVQNKFLKFLINPYLKTLDLRPGSFCIENPGVIVDQLNEIGNTITYLDLRQKYFAEDVIMMIVRSIPCIKELYLSRTESSDEVIKLIGKHCPQLEVLDMSFCNITNSGLHSLVKLSENGDFIPNHILRKLHIISANVTEEGLSFILKYFPLLEILDHEHTPKTIYHFHKSLLIDPGSSQSQTYTLKKLDLMHLGIHSDGFDSDDATVERILKVCSVMCPNLEVINVDNIETITNLQVGCGFTHLKEVKLSSHNILNYSEFIRCRGCNLVELELDTGTVSLDTLTQCCPKLKSLIFQNIKFEKPEVMSKESSGLPCLTYLLLEGYDFFEEEIECAMAIIMCSPNLEVLRLPYCQRVDEQLVNALLKCKCMSIIRKLDFSYSDLTVDLAERFILSTPRLEKITLENCDVTSTEYTVLDRFVKNENLGVEVVWRYNTDESDYEDAFLHFQGRLLNYYEFDLDDYDDYIYPSNCSDDDYCYEDHIDFDTWGLGDSD